MTPAETARAAVANGISVVPPRDNGTKRPIGTWKEYQQRLPTTDELDRWYTNPNTGIGLVCGQVSGNLEMLEFEGRAVRDGLYAEFVELAHAAGLGDLWQRIEDGYFERTPSGGYHFLYRADHIEGNTKLAATQQGEVLIETRGEGGYVITAPTAGHVHPTGRPWQLVAGDITTIPTITRTERAAIHRTARALDHSPSRTLNTPTEHWDQTQQDRPGDRYNRHPDTPARTLSLLLEHGWKLAFTDRYGVHHLTRPGKDPREGTSATLGSPKVGGGFYVFSTSAHPFEAERGYDHYAVYTTLRHQGDWTAGARDLADQGFADPDPDITLKLPTSTPTAGEPDSPGLYLARFEVNWSTVWDEAADVDWLIEPLIVKGRGHSIYAQAKQGKSLLTLNLCANAALGRATLHRPAGTRLRTLYVDMEMGNADLVERLYDMGFDEDDNFEGWLHYLSLPSLHPLDTEQGGQELVDYATHIGADLVVVDTISRAVEGDENESDTYRAFFRHTGMRLKAAGITWVRIDHAGKDKGKGQRGSSAKNDDVDVVWELTRMEDGGVLLKSTHKRLGFVPDKIELDRSDDPLVYTTAKGPTFKPGTKEKAAEFDRAGVPVDATRRQAREYDVSFPSGLFGDIQRYRKQELERSVRLAGKPLSDSADQPTDRHFDATTDGPADQKGPDTYDPEPF